MSDARLAPDFKSLMSSCRHAGDLGNVQEDASGNVDTTITDSYISLQGQYNVINRAIVVRTRLLLLQPSCFE